MTAITDPSIPELTELAADDLMYAADMSGGPADAKGQVENILKRAHGGIYTTNGVGSQSLTVAGGWQQVQQWTGDMGSWRTTPAFGSHQVQLGEVGTYLVGYSCSFVGDPLALYQFSARWDAVEQPQTETEIEVGNLRVNVAGGGLVVCTGAATNLDLMAKVSKDATFDVIKQQLWATRIF